LFAAFFILYYTVAIAACTYVYAFLKRLIKALARAFGLLAGSFKSFASWINSA
jgi:hypothetical protein